MEFGLKRHPELLERAIPAETLSTPSDRAISASPASDAACLSFKDATLGSSSGNRIVRLAATAGGVDGRQLSAGVAVPFRTTLPPIL